MTDEAATVLVLGSLLIVVLASFAALVPGIFRLKHRRYPALVAVAGCGLLIGALALAPTPSVEAEAQQIESRAESRPEQRPPITASSPAWARLAVLQAGSRQPSADTLARFERAFSRL